MVLDGITGDPRVDLGRGWRPSGKLVAAAAALAFLVKLLLAFKTYGTNDVYRWELHLNLSRYLGVGLYRASWDFNHPAAMIHVVRFLDHLAKMSGLPFAFWFRVPAILADVGSLWLVWRMLGQRVEERSIAWALLLLATAPPLLLIAGFHGNTDTVMIFFLLLSVYHAEGGRNWLAGAAFGLAMSVKVVPLMVIPAVFLYLASFRKQTHFFAAAGLVVLISWSPFLFQDPEAIIHQVFGYRSYYGHWGLSYLALTLFSMEPQFGVLNAAFQRFGAYVALGAVLLLSLWMNRSVWTTRSKQAPRLFSQMGIVFLLFLSLSNGFGVQYLAWLAPWVVELGVLPTAIYYAASGVFLFLVYDYWSQGFPWYLADSNRVGDWQGHFDYSQLLCWLSVVFVLWVAWTRMKGRVTLEQSLRLHIRPKALRLAVGLLAVVLVMYPLARRMEARAPAVRVSAGEDAVNEIRAQQYRELSLRLYQLSRFQEAITAAEEALRLDGGSADAYNNIAVSYLGLKKYDEAIQNAEQALRINPDFQLAKNNLAWIRQEQAKGGGVSATPPAPATPEYFLNQSLAHYQAGQYPECIQAARQALKLRPDYAEAYNNIAAADASVGKWDDAIQNALLALRINPNFQLAKNNLAWARSEQGKSNGGSRK